MAEENTEQKQNKKSIFPLLFALINLLVMGSGSYLVYASTIGYHSKVSEEAELQKEIDQFRKSLLTAPVLYNLGQFSTNLNGLPRRFIRVNLYLEMLDEEGFEEVINNSSQVKDEVIRVLNSKRLKDIESLQGKLHLKNQLMERINSHLEKGVVKNIYFSEFIMQ